MSPPWTMKTMPRTWFTLARSVSDGRRTIVHGTEVCAHGFTALRYGVVVMCVLHAADGTCVEVHDPDDGLEVPGTRTTEGPLRMGRGDQEER